ncbi:hypothetical protein IMZ31_21910 (plasmid) [Pontibacillus sp. ALD_SL1]|uniref:hypothetical protein n=1 Tax=Pontibacillus sp. ALD_SL1 TaxID=2777185 RepID=UPI001A95AC8A|nr:hypothetical protein [Pontibacillus sp. ALD_SL1]QST02109.1 hypothetical protein IMZ31_21910 [Pontibacillus sp. ALD_SL1]
MSNPYEEPIEFCPYCDSECMADWADVGVGIVQCGPYHCTNCGASEIGPELSDWLVRDEHGNAEIFLNENEQLAHVFREGHPFSEEERETGWYKGGRTSPYANTVNGKIVDHKTAKSLYDIGLLDEKTI